MASAIMDCLKEELLKKKVENENLKLELQSMRKILESEKECRLAEAMEMKDYFQQQADHFQGQASTSQARLTELEGNYKLLMSSGHSQSQSSATLMEACVRGDGEESKKTKTEAVGIGATNTPSTGIDATNTPSTCEEDISSIYHTALLTSSSIQPESPPLNAGEPAGFYNLDEACSLSSSACSRVCDSPQASAAIKHKLKSETPITHIMSKIYTYTDQYRYEGFMLAFDHINKYYICERCFRVLLCNVFNASLTNHSTRAICTGCTDKKAKRDFRIKAEFEDDLAKLQEKQMAETYELYFLAKGKVIFKQKELTRKAIQDGISFLHFFSSNETIMDSGEETSKLHSSFSMFSDSGITPKTIDTLPDLSAGFTGKGNFFAPVLCSTMASVEERTEEEEESSMEMSSILSRPNDTMVKK